MSANTSVARKAEQGARKERHYTTDSGERKIRSSNRHVGESAVTGECRHQIKGTDTSVREV